MRQALSLYAAALIFGWASSAAAQPDLPLQALGGADSTSATLSAGASVDSTAASDWAAICLSHRDDLQQGGQVAEAAGWKVAPDNLAFPLKNVVGKPQIWLRISASGLQVLAIGRKTDSLFDGGPEFTGSFCVVATKPAEADVQQAAAALVRVPPNPSGGKSDRVTYVYRHTPQGLVPISGDLTAPATVQTIQSPDVDIVQVGGDAEMTLILLIIPEAH